MGIFVDALQRLGIAAQLKKGVDARGEDARLLVGDHELNVQITSITKGDQWRDLSRDGQVEVNVDDAAALVRDAVCKKARTGELGNTILLLDARHLPIATPRTKSEYVARFGDPSEDPGFRAVWIVGPTANDCVCVGGTV